MLCRSWLLKSSSKKKALTSDASAEFSRKQTRTEGWRDATRTHTRAAEDADLHEGLIGANILTRCRILLLKHEQTKAGWVIIDFCCSSVLGFVRHWWALLPLTITSSDILTTFAWLHVAWTHPRSEKILKSHLNHQQHDRVCCAVHSKGPNCCSKAGVIEAKRLFLSLRTPWPLFQGSRNTVATQQWGIKVISYDRLACGENCSGLKVKKLQSSGPVFYRADLVTVTYETTTLGMLFV